MKFGQSIDGFGLDKMGPTLPGGFTKITVVIPGFLWNEIGKGDFFFCFIFFFSIYFFLSFLIVFTGCSLVVHWMFSLLSGPLVFRPVNY